MAADPALVELLHRLDRANYQFVAPTPLTHARVLKRWGSREAEDLRDAFGWSLPFAVERFDHELISLLDRAGALRPLGRLAKSAVRVSRVRGRLFIHSDFPTTAPDSVFLGPDSYRFADFIARELTGDETGLIVDVGGGAGVGALTAAACAPHAQVLTTDVNVLALRYTEAAAAHAALGVEVRQGDGLDRAPEGLAAVLANPPYMTASDQIYRDGGEMQGASLSLQWAEAALDKLAPGGRLLLYTGSAILEGGRDRLRDSLETLARARDAAIRYQEIDPDVFGEELETPAYADIERIAVIGCVMTRPR